MKTLVTIFGISLLTIPILAQKVSDKSFKRDYTDLPTLAVKEIQKVSFKISYPDNTINRDTISGYSGTMKVLKPGERMKKMSAFSYLPIELVNEGADIYVDIAFGEPEILSKEPFEKAYTNLVGDEKIKYYYSVLHSLPTVVRITDASGEILDIWTESPQNRIFYGNKSSTTRKDTEEGEEFVLTPNIFSTVDALDAAYNRKGLKEVKRLAVLYQLKKSIEGFYNRIYFRPTQDKFELITGRGKKHDYSELDKAQEIAIEALEGPSLDRIKESIQIWEKYLTQADPENKKAMISQKIQDGLSTNLVLAYMYLRQFDKALAVAQEFNDRVIEATSKPEDKNFKVTTYKSVGGVSMTADDKRKRQSEWLLNFIKARKNAFDINGDLADTPKVYDAFDFKKEIGRKSKNYKYDLFIAGRRFGEFYRQYEDFHKIGQAAAEVAEEDPLADNPFFPYFMRDPNGVAIKIGAFVAPSMVGEPLTESVLEIEELYVFVATNMKFTSIPEDIGKLSKLQRLNFNNSLLTELPESIGNLSELKSLKVKGNQLTSLPESIKNCTKLKTLHISDNNISEEEMAKIKSWIPKKCKVK